MPTKVYGETAYNVPESYEGSCSNIEILDDGIIVVDGIKCDIRGEDIGKGVDINEYGARVYFFKHSLNEYELIYRNYFSTPPPRDVSEETVDTIITYTSDDYPVYHLWPDRQRRVPQTITNTIGLSSDSDFKKRLSEEWFVRLNDLADFYDERERVVEWESSLRSENPLIAHSAGTNRQKGATNTMHHYPKGIGIGWRVVNKFYDASYSTYGVPAIVNCNGIEVSIDIDTGNGINELVSCLEEEYGYISFKNGLSKNPIRTRHNITSKVDVLKVWDGYYTSSTYEWWFTNFDTYGGDTLLYRTSDRNDWEDLYTEYTKARDWR